MSYLLFILLNVFLILIFSKIANKINLVDIPNHRKLHDFNVPLIGGICIYLMFFWNNYSVSFFRFICYLLISNPRIKLFQDFIIDS